MVDTAVSKICYDYTLNIQITQDLDTEMLYVLQGGPQGGQIFCHSHAYTQSMKNSDFHVKTLKLGQKYVVYEITHVFE